MSTPPDSPNPSSSPERREQTAAFLKEFWKEGLAVGACRSPIGGTTSWYDIALAAWLAACDYQKGRDDDRIVKAVREFDSVTADEFFGPESPR